MIKAHKQYGWYSSGFGCQYHLFSGSFSQEKAVLPHYRPSGSKIALVWLTGICGRYVSVTQKLGGCGGMLPQENFLNLML